VTQWTKEDDSRKRLLQNICEYPYILEEQQLVAADGQQYLDGPPDFIIKKKANRTSYSQ